MKLSSTHVAAVAALLQYCQAALIPPELSTYFNASQELVAIFNGTNITQAAQLIPTAETQSAPKIQIPSSLPADRYIFLMVDPDYNTTVPTNVVLHTIVGNLTAGSPNGDTKVLTASDAALAAYVGPEPPAGKASHNYTLLLFAQPSNFSIPSAFDSFLPLNLSDVLARTNFPLVDFVKQTSLGQPLAATYFRLNLTSSTASSSSSASSASATMASASASTTASAGSKNSLEVIVFGTMLFGLHFLIRKM